MYVASVTWAVVSQLVQGIWVIWVISICATPLCQKNLGLSGISYDKTSSSNPRLSQPKPNAPPRCPRFGGGIIIRHRQQHHTELCPSTIPACRLPYPSSFPRNPALEEVMPFLFSPHSHQKPSENEKTPY